MARPDAHLLVGFERLDGAELVSRRFSQARRDTWRYPAHEQQLPDLGAGHAWRIDLSSPRPFHPERLLDHIETLADGPFRSRGCFWVPTRPQDALEWSGAGGQLSIGAYSTWGRRTPRTRLIFTGTGAPPAGLEGAFERLLLAPEEALLRRRSWDVLEDGLEPWLGDIHDLA
ncbi:GTP-binding protein [Nocardioides sp. W7]|uniref:GTP-binding protein n=1 Tax=Nocardioides sp. W7 TaxID=2931390 RepID=UPI001FD21474|nr:GTP-binding protein [Nocardioides sp. W7]